MAKVKLISDKAMNHIVSRLPVVNEAVRKETNEIAGRARRNLAGHRDTGNARIETSFTKTDGIVSLVDPAAESIEWGHWFTGFGWANPAFPRYVAGLYIITRAAGLA